MENGVQRRGMPNMRCIREDDGDGEGDDDDDPACDCDCDRAGYDDFTN